MSNEFSVVQFFEDGQYEKIVSFVSAEKATEVFKAYITNVAARTGITLRVIITDGGDCINAEWIYGIGITYPPKEGEEIK